jgi:TraB/PrgY/gumN family
MVGLCRHALLWQSGRVKKPLSALLSLCLGFFLADALVSLLDDTIILVSGFHALDVVRGLVCFVALGAALIVYVLMGITPAIPKRVFLPVVLFNPLSMLAVIPISIYHSARLQQVAWVLSACQVVVALAAWRWAQGGWRFRWPALAEDKLQGSRFFTWGNLCGFALANLLVVAPGLVLYLGVCASLAVGHFSGGFLVLRRDGLAVRARQYVRGDGKTIQLIPMMHIGESNFYRQVSAAMPSNSVVLLEGVTDRKDLLRHKLDYKRMATSLGLTDQHDSFAPGGSQARHADVDIDQFSKETLNFLNTASLLHSKGLTEETLRELFFKAQPPDLMDRLWEDLLVKRNEHLLKELRAELADSDSIVVPWGAAHMPGIARAIQQQGFRLSQTHEYQIFRFRTLWRRAAPRKAAPPINPKSQVRGFGMVRQRLWRPTGKKGGPDGTFPGIGTRCQPLAASSLAFLLSAMTFCSNSLGISS